jgi:hypothetical protein
MLKIINFAIKLDWKCDLYGSEPQGVTACLSSISRSPMTMTVPIYRPVSVSCGFISHVTNPKSDIRFAITPHE